MPRRATAETKKRQYQIMVDGESRNIYLGVLPEWKYVETKRRLDTLKRCLKLGEAPDETTTKWLDSIDDDLHEKIMKAGLTKSRCSDTLGVFIDSFLAGMKRQPNTMKNYRDSAESLLDFLGRNADPRAVTRKDAEAYREHLKTRGRKNGEGYGQNSVWKKLQHASKFFEEMLFEKLIQENPFQGFSTPPTLI